MIRHLAILPSRSYGVDAAFMQLEQHGWDIHALCAAQHGPTSENHQSRKPFKRRRDIRGEPQPEAGRSSITGPGQAVPRRPASVQAGNPSWLSRVVIVRSAKASMSQPC